MDSYRKNGHILFMLTHMNPYGPMWTHMDPYEPIWTHMGPYGLT